MALFLLSSGVPTLAGCKKPTPLRYNVRMDAIRLFQDESLRPPLTGRLQNEDLPSYMGRVFESFLETYDKLDGTDVVTQRIKNARPKAKRLCSDLLGCVRRCLAGEPYAAFVALSEGLEKVGEEVDSLRSSNVGGQWHTHRTLPSAIDRRANALSSEGHLSCSIRTASPSAVATLFDPWATVPLSRRDDLHLLGRTGSPAFSFAICC